MTDTANDTTLMDTAVDYYLEHSTVKNNGVREVRKADFVKGLEARHGVTEEDYKKVQDALKFETTAAARVATADLEKKASEASKDDLKSDEFRKGLSAAVRLPTFGGSTEVEVFGEKWDNLPRREGMPEDAPTHKVTHGRVRVSINTKRFIDGDFVTEAQDRIRTALGQG